MIWCPPRERGENTSKPGRQPWVPGSLCARKGTLLSIPDSPVCLRRPRPSPSLMRPSWSYGDSGLHPFSPRSGEKWGPAIVKVIGAYGVLSGSESQVSGSAQLFHSLWSQTSPFIYLLKHVRLVGLKDGHRVEGHACLTGRDVGLSDKGRSGPTWLSRKEVAGLPGRRQRGWKVGGQSVLYHRHGGVTLLHRTHKVGEVSGWCVSKAGGKRLFPGSGDLLMQITEKRQLPPFRPGIWAAKEPLVEFRSLRLAGLVGPIQRKLLSGVRKHVHELRVGRWRLRLLAARRELIR